MKFFHVWQWKKSLDFVSANLTYIQMQSLSYSEISCNFFTVGHHICWPLSIYVTIFMGHTIPLIGCASVALLDIPQNREALGVISLKIKANPSLLFLIGDLMWAIEAKTVIVTVQDDHLYYFLFSIMYTIAILLDWVVKFQIKKLGNAKVELQIENNFVVTFEHTDFLF